MWIWTFSINTKPLRKVTAWVQNKTNASMTRSRCLSSNLFLVYTWRGEQSTCSLQILLEIVFFFFSEVIKIVLWVLFIQRTFAFSAKTHTLIQKKKKLNLSGYLLCRKHLQYWHSWSLRKLVLVEPLPSATACSSGKINMGWTNFPGIRGKRNRKKP